MDTIADHVNQKDEIERLKKQLKSTGEFYANFYESKIYNLCTRIKDMKESYSSELKRLVIDNDKL
jgi:hypothetical protein